MRVHARGAPPERTGPHLSCSSRMSPPGCRVCVVATPGSSCQRPCFRRPPHLLRVAGGQLVQEAHLWSRKGRSGSWSQRKAQRVKRVQGSVRLRTCAPSTHCCTGEDWSKKCHHFKHCAFKGLQGPSRAATSTGLQGQQPPQVLKGYLGPQALKGSKLLAG